MKANLCLKENKRGNDYVVSDIHGEYDKLMHKLITVGFDFDRDRLLSCGDGCDRGPKSREVIELLDESWFFSTLGNHEMMCIDAYKYSWASHDFVQNGGLWFYDLMPHEQDRVIERLLGLPLTIQVEVNGAKNLLIHACVPGHVGMSAYLNENTKMQDVPTEYISNAVWTRIFLTSYGKSDWVGLTKHVHGFNKVFVGHTPVDKMPVMSDNYINMDTGVVFYPEREFVFYNIHKGCFV